MPRNKNNPARGMPKALAVALDGAEDNTNSGVKRTRGTGYLTAKEIEATTGRPPGKPGRTTPNYKLTERQKAFFEHLATAPSARQAAVRAGYSPTIAQREASRLMKDIRGREMVQRVFAEEGLVFHALARVIKGGLEANRTALDMQGNVVDLGPDWTARYKWGELAAKITGALPDPRLEITGDGGGAVIVRHSPTLD